MSSSTPTPLKGIAVDYEIQIPPTCDYYSSDSYSDSSSLDWLREEEVDAPSNYNDKDGSSRKQAKKTAIEDHFDASENLDLDTHPTDNTNPTCKSLPSENVHPLDRLATKSPSQATELCS